MLTLRHLAVQKLRSMVHEIVGRINGRYGTLTENPIHHLDRQLSFHELCALYAVTDVLLVASLRDGMNLVSYEYVACQSDNAGAGLFYLSRFTRCRRPTLRVPSVLLSIVQALKRDAKLFVSNAYRQTTWPSCRQDKAPSSLRCGSSMPSIEGLLALKGPDGLVQNVRELRRGAGAERVRWRGAIAGRRRHSGEPLEHHRHGGSHSGRTHYE